MTTPMGTCCDECKDGGIPRLQIRHCNKLGDCPCHTAPPTARSVNDLTMEEAQALVASGQGAFIPTPNTGTVEIKAVPVLTGYLNVSIKEYEELKAQGILMEVKEVKEALATQKSQLIAEVEGMKTHSFDNADYGEVDGLVYKDDVIALLKDKGVE